MSDGELRASLNEAAEKNPDLNDKLSNASNAREVVEVLREQGIETTQAELVKAEARKILELDDAALESADINVGYTTDTLGGCPTWIFGCCPSK